MKIIEKEKGDTIQYYYLLIELEDGREAEVVAIQTYYDNPDLDNTEIEVSNSEEFSRKEIEKIKQVAEENYK